MRPISVNLHQCETLKCANCDCEHFQPITVIKKISAILTGSEGNVAFVKLWKCDNCGEVLDAINPLKEDNNNSQNLT